MYRLKLVVVILAASVICGDASAQEFGRGRFLKKLRDEITGANRKPKTPPKTDPKGKKTPTPVDARRPSNPTQSRTSAQAQQRAQQQRAQQQARLRAQQQQQQRSNSFVPPAFNPKSRNYNPLQARENKSSGRQNTSQNRKGFGMEIATDRSGNLVVERIDSRGNAAEAGLRKGDVINKVGGVEVKDEKEFGELTEVLGEGDQIEFEFVQRGKKQKANVQFGNIPEEHAPVAQNDEAPPEFRNDGAGLKSVIDRPTGSGAVNQNQASSRNQSQIDAMRRTIESQQKTISQLQYELNRLKSANSQVRAPQGLRLNGPGR